MECDKCGGWRFGCMHEGRFSPQHCADATVTCPKCGGSGYVNPEVRSREGEA